MLQAQGLETRAQEPQEKTQGTKNMGAMFERIEAQYGVPREILSAIWGMETAYGKVLGSFDAPRQLATLGYKGSRTKLGEEQLIATMKAEAFIADVKSAFGQSKKHQRNEPLFAEPPKDGTPGHEGEDLVIELFPQFMDL